MVTRWWATLLAVVLIAACGRAGSTPAAPEPTPAAGAVVAMITHQPPGDAFWDVVKRGAQTSADLDGLTLEYSNDPDPVGQARLITDAVERRVAGMAVTLADPAVLAPAVQAATQAGIPVVALNTGVDAWSRLGVLSYFGQDDGVAGRAAGERLARERARNALCVIQAADHAGLEARCAGAATTFAGVVQPMHVDGTRPAAVKDAIVAKLQQDRSIDRVLTLSAAVALTALQAVGEANSYAKVATFDTSPAVLDAISRGTVSWAIDQQPYLQGYLSINALWLYFRKGSVIGGGRPTLTGPAFVDESNVEVVSDRAKEGTR